MQYLRALLFFAFAGGLFYEGFTNVKTASYTGKGMDRIYTGEKAILLGKCTMGFAGLIALVGVYCLVCGLLRRPDFGSGKPNDDDWD